jgi:uncharacterized phage protein gp47/JayE
MADNYIPQIDYTSRDYEAIRTDLYNLIPIFAPQWTSRDPNDIGIAILEVFAHLADVLNYYIDRAASEAFISTASQRDSVLRIAKMLGYTPTDTSPSAVTLTFQNSSDADIVVPALTQVQAEITVNGKQTAIIFETDSDVTVPAQVGSTPGSADVTATQGYTVSDELLGASDGTGNQTFILANSPVIQNSISIIIGTTVYNHVSYLIESDAQDAVFTSSTNAEFVTSVEFGDNIGGKIPPTNSQIYATYRVGGGAETNVSSGTITTILTNYQSGLSVNNSAAAIGGADIESIESVRINAPLSVSSGNRAVSLSDYASLAVQVTGVAKAVADAVTSNSVNVYIAPFGDRGTDGSGDLTTVFTNLATKVEAYLQPKMPPAATVTILPPSFVGINLTVVVSALPQWKNTTVQINAQKALQEILTFDNVVFGEKITMHYIMSALANTPGVNYSNVTLIARADGPQSGTTDITLAVNELPEAGTILVSVSGGIS